jgi:hypothetical protein
VNTSHGQHETLLLDETLTILTSPTGVPNYDFSFREWFPCRSNAQVKNRLQAVARVGAPSNYQDFFNDLSAENVILVHTPTEHLECSELPRWYPLLKELTPKSIWFTQPPTLSQVKAALTFPIFMKGARQTTRHRRDLAIIQDADAFNRAIVEYRTDSILKWQDIVCREFVPLRLVGKANDKEIPRSFEFQTFWWKGHLVGANRYWVDENYTWTAAERRTALAMAEQAAQRVKVTFLVVDVAQKKDGEWIVIECNDAQESGYAGVSPVGLWQSVLDLEKGDC